MAPTDSNPSDSNPSDSNPRIDPDLALQFLRQLYEDSLVRYGRDHEQTLLLAKYVNTPDSDLTAETRQAGELRAVPGEIVHSRFLFRPDHRPSSVKMNG
jgi:hypothetical protein